MKESKSKPVPDTAIKLHKALAMNKPVETGAGKGPYGGNPGKKTPC